MATEGSFDAVISEYTQEQAIADGVLVDVGLIGDEKVVFTGNLFADGYEDTEKRKALVELGIQKIQEPDKEDSDYMQLRVLEKDRIWLIRDGNGFTFMRPEDY